MSVTVRIGYNVPKSIEINILDVTVFVLVKIYISLLNKAQNQETVKVDLTPPDFKLFKPRTKPTKDCARSFFF